MSAMTRGGYDYPCQDMAPLRATHPCHLHDVPRQRPRPEAPVYTPSVEVHERDRERARAMGLLLTSWQIYLPV